MLFETDKIKIGEIIKKHRKQLKYTQFELAEKVGLNEKQISRIESGLNYPTYLTFIKLLETLDISFTEFLKDSKKDSIFEIQIKNEIKNMPDNKSKLIFEIIKLIKQN